MDTRELILDILLAVCRDGEYSHVVLRQTLEKYQYLQKCDRAFITRVSEGTIQHMIELDYIIDQFSKIKTVKMKAVVLHILRMGVFQLKYMDSVPSSAACNEAVKLAKKRGFSALSGFVNGVLRNIARNLDGIPYPDEEKEPIRALSVSYSMPEWLVRQWERDYGMERTKGILSAFLREAPLVIRTNLSKITPRELKIRLEAEGADVRELEEIPELDYALLLSGYNHLNALSCFREGLFYVQDLGSMLVAEYAAPKEGDFVLDVCAAPGGKSVHIAEKLNGTGMVEARDISEAKISLIEENIARCGHANIRTKIFDAAVWDEKMAGRADIVIADLPCSGLGVLRKKPDIKYKMTEDAERELAALQRNILDTVCGYVKEGGTLIYSTCTMNRMENEENVEWFRGKHPEFAIQECRQIFPGEEYGDGFFLAKLERRA